MVDIHDANIVVIPEEPLKQVANAASWAEEGEFALLMRKPLTINQGLTFDVSLGTTTGMYQIESMRSQKVISLSSQRIEVHDRSGEADLTKAQIPRTMTLLIDALNPGRIKAVGANWEVVFKSPDAISAGAEIAEKLLRRDISFLSRNIRLIGGSARLYLSDSSGIMYVLAFEPRGQNIETEELWMTCNANITYPENFSNELLESMFRQSYNLLFEVKESLFPVP